MRRNKFLNSELMNLTPNSGTESQNIFLGEVVSIDDPLNSGRIKVRVQGLNVDQNKPIFCIDLENKKGDNKTEFIVKKGNETLKLSDDSKKEIRKEQRNSTECEELPWCLPLLPLHLQVMPKVGELVTIMFFNNDKKHLNRFWISPVVSDKSNLSYQLDKTAASNFETSRFNSGNNTSNTNTIELKKRGDFTGGFPEKLDIAIQSRNNADIVLPNKGEKFSALNTGGEIILRAGKFKFKDPNSSENKLELNDKNPGYIRLKVVESGGRIGPETHTIILSDYITIASYKNGEEGGSTTAQPVNPIMESDDDIKNFHRGNSPMVKGDELVEFLELLKNYVVNHNHPYHKHPATNANSKTEIESFDLNRLLSKNIRIN